MAILHLIHGLVGSGKTTFAKKLAEEIGAIRFTCDEWMILLFGNDPPKEYFDKYEPKIKQLMWGNAKELLLLNKDVILDFGLWRRAERDYFRKEASAINAQVKLYHLKCPDKVRYQRVLSRTSVMPTGAYVINEAALREIDARYEPLDPVNEKCILIKT